MSANLFLPTLAKNLRTAGIWGDLPAVQRGFSPTSIFRICQSPPLQILIPNTSFLPLPKIGANSLKLPCPSLLHLLYKVPHKGKQGTKKENHLTTRLAMFFLFCALLYSFDENYSQSYSFFKKFYVPGLAFWFEIVLENMKIMKAFNIIIQILFWKVS